jgi:hypothetical protein
LFQTTVDTPAKSLWNLSTPPIRKNTIKSSTNYSEVESSSSFAIRQSMRHLYEFLVIVWKEKSKFRNNVTNLPWNLHLVLSFSFNVRVLYRLTAKSKIVIHTGYDKIHNYWGPTASPKGNLYLTSHEKIDFSSERYKKGTDSYFFTVPWKKE